MKKKLSVSMMCADLMNMERDAKRLAALGVDWFHMDVMDAHFVPNLTFGPDMINALHKVSDIPMDIHLMMEDPELLLQYLDLKPTDWVTIHSELPDNKIEQTLKHLKQMGVHTGLALNPETPVDKLSKWLDDIDLILLMLVHPGFSGQKTIDGIMDKVAETKSYLKQNGKDNILISTDGNITVERAKYMAQLGADIFVGGTSAVFRKGMKLEDTVPTFFKTVE